jgi:hypothetical protein
MTSGETYEVNTVINIPPPGDDTSASSPTSVEEVVLGGDTPL